jgi:hypothetical protein
MKTFEYIPNLPRGVKVVLIGRDSHPKNGQRCIVVAALPNPSRRSEHQWYDVRFNDYSMGRFLERCLDRVDEKDKGTAA